ncbi:hypothetical protein [Anabaena subtropica]|uniref:histidine kinase n=1 Tax=Anabaena subtropica FACHB-260 TaxID=2692884 RepID=A0ABR8CRK3_9NOST|nr:hypothetical protein [Anabaena subtropica]MBD2345416.1 hypothetical protein [Anabaena subtropica FACHB-260]
MFAKLPSINFCYYSIGKNFARISLRLVFIMPFALQMCLAVELVRYLVLKNEQEILIKYYDELGIFANSFNIISRDLQRLFNTEINKKIEFICSDRSQLKRLKLLPKMQISNNELEMGFSRKNILVKLLKIPIYDDSGNIVLAIANFSDITKCEQTEHLVAQYDHILKTQVNRHTKELRLANLPKYIQTDESKLRQVLLNILGNSIKFTETGSVTLRVKLGAGESQEVGGQGAARGACGLQCHPRGANSPIGDATRIQKREQRREKNSSLNFQSPCFNCSRF